MEHELAPLIMPIWAFPLIAAALFAVSMFVAFTYRDVYNRHSDKTGASPSDDGHDAHGSHH